MAVGARITDEINRCRQLGNHRAAVRALRSRRPERLRWRAAVASMTTLAAGQRGISRARIEEPIRELVLNMEDRVLRRETVLDARRVGVDLDRGEVLPIHTRWDLKRTSYLIGVEHELLGRYMTLPADYGDLIDTAGCVVVCRSFSRALAARADRWLSQFATAGDLPVGQERERLLFDRARYERDQAQRWMALSRALVSGSR